MREDVGNLAASELMMYESSNPSSNPSCNMPLQPVRSINDQKSSNDTVSSIDQNECFAINTQRNRVFIQIGSLDSKINEPPQSATFKESEEKKKLKEDSPRQRKNTAESSFAKVSKLSQQPTLKLSPSQINYKAQPRQKLNTVTDKISSLSKKVVGGDISQFCIKDQTTTCSTQNSPLFKMENKESLIAPKKQLHPSLLMLSNVERQASSDEKDQNS